MFTLRISLIFLTFFVLFQVSCSVFSKTNEPLIYANKLTIKNIKCINLSEDMSKLSTHEDEILIKIDLIEHGIDSALILNKVYEEVKVFENREDLHEVNRTINIDQYQDKLLILLIELDENNSERRVVEISDSLILEKVFDQGNFDLSTIDSLFGHDDFLGISLIKLQNPFKRKKNLETIKGMQLFDRYEYEIEYEVQ